MQTADWDRALARVEFVRQYVGKIRKEIAMKNEQTHASAPTTQVPPRQPWPAHRRFWHRSPAPEAPRSQHTPPAKTEPRPSKTKATPM